MHDEKISLKRISNKIYGLSLFTTLVFSIWFKLFHLTTFSFWHDEACTAWFAKQSYSNLWFFIPKFESHPPLYYTMVKLWTSLSNSTSDASYRSLSLVLSVMLAGMVYLLIKETTKYLSIDSMYPCFLGVCFVCFHRTIIWYSIEARPYMFFSLAYSVSLYGFLLLLPKSNEEENKNSYKKLGWVCTTFGTILTMWSHHCGVFFAFFLAFSFIAHWIINLKKEKTFLKTSLLSVCIVTIFSIPLFFMVLNRLPIWSSSTWVPEASLSQMHNVGLDLYTFTGVDSYIWAIFGRNLYGSIMLAIIKFLTIPILLYGIYHLCKRKKGVMIFFLLSSIFGSFALSFLITLLGPNIFLKKTLIPCLIPFFIFLSISIGFIKSKFFKKIILCFIILLLIAGTITKIRFHKRNNWSQLTNSFIKELQEGDVFLVMPNSYKLLLEHYDKKGKLLPHAHGLPAEYFVLNKSSFFPTGTAVTGVSSQDYSAISLLVKGYKRVFLLTKKEKIYDPNFITRQVLFQEYSLRKSFRWQKLYLHQYERVK